MVIMIKDDLRLEISYLGIHTGETLASRKQSKGDELNYVRTAFQGGQRPDLRPFGESKGLTGSKIHCNHFGI